MVVAIQPFSDMEGSTPVIYLDLPDYDMDSKIDATGITFNYGNKQAFFGSDGISFRNESLEVTKGITDTFETTDSFGRHWKLYVNNGIIYKKIQI